MTDKQAPHADVPRCPHCKVPLTGMNANPDECLHKPAVEGARCDHGVLAGQHCSVCGTLSDPPRTPLRDAAQALLDELVDWQNVPSLKALEDLRAALRAATPAGPTIREVCKGPTYHSRPMDDYDNEDS